MDTLSIGLIGGGFIGKAFYKVFNHYNSVKIFDLNPDRRTHELPEVVEQDIIIVAVPTPMCKDGSVDETFVREALNSIRNNTTVWKPVILKSTLPPDTMGEIIEEFKDSIYFVFSPEFLTERTAEYDLQQSNRFIFGIPDEYLNEDSVQKQMIEHLFSNRFPAVPRYWVSYRTASLVKYFTNVFFATKVALLNEFCQVATGFKVDWTEVISLVLLDSRIGRSHFQVPGHDGQYGYGGSCFLKDINEFKHLAKDQGVNPMITEAAWKKNIEVRGSKNLARELNKMVGRAASVPFTEDDIKDL